MKNPFFPAVGTLSFRFKLVNSQKKRSQKSENSKGKSSLTWFFVAQSFQKTVCKNNRNLFLVREPAVSEEYRARHLSVEDIFEKSKFETQPYFKFSDPHSSSGRRFFTFFFAQGIQNFYEDSRTQTVSYPTHRSSEEKRVRCVTQLRQGKSEISRNPSPQIWASCYTGYLFSKWSRTRGE